MTVNGQKHLVRCSCILSQYKQRKDAPQHQFVVFSEVGDDGNVVVKYAQCNNCGVIHKVTGLCESEVLVGRDTFSITTIDDIKLSLSEKVVKVLESHSVDLPTWEMARFIVENQRWGDHVILSSDTDGKVRQGKYMRILGENMVKVEPFVREEVIG